MSASYSDANATDLPDKSRRKNCNACVRSKRCCDKRTPQCTRCAKKGFSCVYQSLPPSSSSSAAASAAAANPSAEPADHPPHAVDLEGGGVPTPPQPFDFNDLDNSHSVSALGIFPTGASAMPEPADSNIASALLSIGFNLDANMIFDFSSVLIGDSMQDNNMQLWEMQQAPAISKTVAPELPQQVESESCQRDEILGGFQPWHIYEPDSRLGFLVSYFTNLHTTFAQTKETPFLHRHLYRGLASTPRPLIAAYTALSAYAGRTDANRGWAIRAVYEGAAEVLESVDESVAASSAATSGHERLARAQALWLLQTIRCFDGDVSLRAAAVRDMGALKRCLKDLEGLRDNLDDVHLLDNRALRQRPPRSWEVWVFNECVRRTVFLGNLFTSLFQILLAASDNNGETDIVKWMAPHRWTFSKALWDAQSSPEFFLKWREQPVYIINSFYVQVIAKVARPADIDEFARVFLIFAFGVEETKHFMLQA